MPDKGIDQSWITAIDNARLRSEDIRQLVNIDQSWVLAINAAVARHLKFGREIIFTFGPYGSIYTRSFNPATDRLMMLGSCCLALSYAIAFLFLSWNSRFYWPIAFVVVAATFPSPDALLLSYPFLLLVCLVKFVTTRKAIGRVKLRSLEVVGTCAVLAGLALLPLIKGSLMLPAGLAVVVIEVFSISKVRLRQAITLLAMPLASVCVFWTAASQRVIDLPLFLYRSLPLVSGYSEAMSSTWTAWPDAIGYGLIMAYLLIAAGICAFVVCCRALTASTRFWIELCCAPFLFVAFKHGFVRADHEVIAFASLALFICIIGCLYRNRYLAAMLWIVLGVLTGISVRRSPVLIKDVRASFGAGTVSGRPKRDMVKFIVMKSPAIVVDVTLKNLWSTYSSAWFGMGLRVDPRNVLHSRFVEAMKTIHREYPLPLLKGSGDVYTYEQAILLASDNKWDPRPIFQSYSAYTPWLLRTNEEHLRGNGAPDWIVFDLFAIDERLPSLEDGMSWPALLDNYAISRFDGEFVMLQRKNMIQTKTKWEIISQEDEEIGTDVPLPDVAGILYAEVKLKPTLGGKMATTLYKAPALRMVLRLVDGETRIFRIVPNMMATGFVISPLVANTAEFALLEAGDPQFLKEHRVAQISIVPSGDSMSWWNKSYAMTLKKYVPTSNP